MRPALPSRRPLVLDGGLATQLERQGEDLSSALWSAAVLRSHPEAITQAHTAFFAAGAEVATTATYQLTELSLARSGLDVAEFLPLVRTAVHAARVAREDAGAGWVVGSVGPYGASLANGAEYTGDYGLGHGEAAVRALREHHRPRLQALLEAGVDALACETIPTMSEVEALVDELRDMHLDLPVWVSLTPAPGGRSTRTGEDLAQASSLVADLPTAYAVGVNCCPPEDVPAALAALAPCDYGLRAIAYPNSGEVWDATARTWTGQAAWDADALQQWQALGASAIGGCCRVFSEQIAAISAAMLRHAPRTTR